MKIAIVDRNKELCTTLKRRIDEYRDPDGVMTYCDMFTNADEFMARYYQSPYDLVYLSVELREGNGLDMASLIHQNNENTMIIMMSDSIQNVYSSFNVNAFQFLIKPIDDLFFYNEFKRAIQQFRRKKKAYIFPTTDGNMVFHMDNILYIESLYKEYTIVCKDKTYTGAIKDIQTVLNTILEHTFFRVDRSHYVNLSNVTRYDREFITMSNDEKIPVSRHKFYEFERQLFRLWDSL